MTQPEPHASLSAAAPLSATALGIETWEHAALLALLAPLRDGTAAVDMAYVDNVVATGRCVGAHVAATAAAVSPDAPPEVAAHAFGYVCGYGTIRASAPLRPLYAPGAGQPNGGLNHPGWRATAAQAARAIAAFLAGAGATCWEFMHVAGDSEPADG